MRPHAKCAALIISAVPLRYSAIRLIVFAPSLAASETSHNTRLARESAWRHNESARDYAQWLLFVIYSQQVSFDTSFAQLRHKFLANNISKILGYAGSFLFHQLLINKESDWLPSRRWMCIEPNRGSPRRYLAPTPINQPFNSWHRRRDTPAPR